MSKRTDAYCKFQEKMQFVDIYEAGNKLSKISVFDRHYCDRGENSILTLVMAKMYPEYDYIQSSRMNDVDNMAIEEDSVLAIITRRALLATKKARVKMNENGELVTNHEKLLSLLVSFGISCYNDHEKIFSEV